VPRCVPHRLLPMTTSEPLSRTIDVDRGVLGIQTVKGVGVKRACGIENDSERTLCHWKNQQWSGLYVFINHEPVLSLRGQESIRHSILMATGKVGTNAGTPLIMMAEAEDPTPLVSLPERLHRTLVEDIPFNRLHLCDPRLKAP